MEACFKDNKNVLVEFNRFSEVSTGFSKGLTSVLPRNTVSLISTELQQVHSLHEIAPGKSDQT